VSSNDYFLRRNVVTLNCAEMTSLPVFDEEATHKKRFYKKV